MNYIADEIAVNGIHIAQIVPNLYLAFHLQYTISYYKDLKYTYKSDILSEKEQYTYEQI
jgi:hypothetical protein